MRRDDWVDAAKGLSILLVVLLHTSLWLRQAGMERIPAVSAVNLATEDLRMPLFFAMAGLFAAKWIHCSWPDFLRSKAALLGWVFLVWQVPVIAYRILAGLILPGPTPTDLSSQLQAMAWSPLRANAELWFLWALLAFFLLARAVRRWPPAPVVTAAAAVSVLWSGVLQPEGGGELHHLIGTGLFKAPVYFVFFAAAAGYGPVIRDAVARVPRPVAALVAAGWVVAFAWQDVLAPVRDMPGAEFLGQVAGVAGGIAIAVALERVRPLRHLGRHTLGIYVSHTTTVVAIACVLFALGVPLDAWTVAAVGAAATITGLLLGRVAGGTWLLSTPVTLRRVLGGDGRSTAAGRHPDDPDDPAGHQPAGHQTSGHQPASHQPAGHQTAGHQAGAGGRHASGTAVRAG